MRTHPLRPNLALVLACLLALLLFFVGIALPEVHFWASYLLPVVLAFLWGRRRDVYIVAAFASVLLVAAYWTGGTATADDFVTGHLLPLAVVWGLAWLLAQRQQMQEQLVAQQQSLEEQVKTRTAALAANEQRYRLLAENAGDLIWTVEMDGKMTYASPAAQRLRGVTGEEEQSASWFDRLPPAAAARAAAALQTDLAALRAGEPIDATPRPAPTYRKDGTLMWTETVMSPIYDDSGRPLGLCGSTRDITERKRLEARAERLAALVDAAQDAVMSADLDGTIVTLNRSAEELYGTPAAAVVGRTMAALTPPEYVEPLEEMMGRVASGEAMVIDDVAWRLPDGSKRILAISLSPIRDSSDKVIAFTSIARDVTDRKQLEDVTNRLAAIVESSPDAIAATDLHGRVVSWNPSAERLYECSASQAIGRPINEILPPSPDTDEAAIVAKVYSGATVSVADRGWTKADGTRVDLSVILSPIKDKLGAVTGIASIARDITARMAAERERLFLSALVASSPDAVVGRTVDGTITSWNHGAERLFGYTAGEAIGQNLTMLAAPGRMEQMVEVMAEVAQGKAVEVVETQRITKDGRIFDCQISSFPVRDTGGAIIGVASFTHDITERKAAERALRASEERFTRLFNSSPVAISLTRLADGLYQEVNEAFLTLIGYSRAEVIGRTSLELGIISPEDRQRLADELQVQGSLRGTDLVIHTQRGELLNTLFSIDLVDFEGESYVLSSVVDITRRRQLEEALAASERKYRDLYDNSPDMYFVGVPAQGLILDCNQTLAHTLGYTREELIGGPSNTLFDAASYTQMLKDSNELLAAGSYDNYEIRLRCRDGTLLDALMSVTLEQDPTGGPARARVTLHDITERKRLEVELRHSEQKWRSVFEFLPVGLSVVDGKDKVTDSNPALAQILGLPPDGVLNGRYAQRRYFHADMRPMAANEFPSQQALSKGQVVRDVVIGIEKEDGELIWVSVSATPESIDGLSLTATVDITVRKRMEDALAASEHKYRDLYDNSPDMYVSGYSNGFFRDCNLTAARTLGYTRDELMGLPTSTIFTPASYSSVVAELPKHLAAEAWDNFEVQLQCKDGTVLDALLSAEFEPATADHLAYSRVTLHDITERKRAEAALSASEAQLRAVIENTEDSVWSVDAGYHLLVANSLFVRGMQQIGRTPAIGESVVTDPFPAGTRALYDRAMAGEVFTLEAPSSLHTGGTIAYHLHPIYAADGTISGVSCRAADITPLKHAEAQLRTAYERLHLAADAARIGVWTWSFADGRLDWDDRMCELYAVTAAERAAGIFYDLWRARIHPEDLAPAEPAQGVPNRLDSAFAQAYRILLPDGAVRHIQASSVTEYDKDGKPQRMVGVNRDITDEVHYQRLLQDTNAVLEESVAARTAELQTALDELQRAGKLKDEFMAMISHELRTPLTGVLSMSEMLEDQIAGPLNDRQAYYVKGIIHSGERLLAVINGILSYTHLLSGKVQLQAEPCDLASVLGICAASQQHKAAAKSQTIAVKVEPPGLAITADATALTEVLKRLLDNAVKFTPDGGQIGLEADLSSTPDTVDLVVWDTGIGIAADQLDTVFHAFIQADARLSRSHEGIGIGLAYADEMVRMMGGTIRLESTPGEGSRFTITLPAAE